MQRAALAAASRRLFFAGRGRRSPAEGAAAFVHCQLAVQSATFGSCNRQRLRAWLRITLPSRGTPVSIVRLRAPSTAPLMSNVEPHKHSRSSSQSMLQPCFKTPLARKQVSIAAVALKKRATRSALANRCSPRKGFNNKSGACAEARSRVNAGQSVELPQAASVSGLPRARRSLPAQRAAATVLACPRLVAPTQWGPTLPSRGRAPAGGT